MRKTLRLKYGSNIKVKIKNSVFKTKIDERGRFSVPAKVRKICAKKFVPRSYDKICAKQNSRANIGDGRSSIMVSILVCGVGVPAFPYNPMQPNKGRRKTSGVGSIPAYGPTLKNKKICVFDALPLRSGVAPNEVIKNE